MSELEITASPSIIKKKDLKQLIQEEYVKCVADPVHFMSKYCFIQHPIKGKVPFILYPFQKDTLYQLRDNDYNIILKSRQLGISTLVAAYSLWLMMFSNDKNVLVIATKQDVAKNLVTKVRVMQQNLPSWLKNQCIEDNKLSLRFKNGSQIKAISSSPEGARSEALSLLILDECAFIENVEDIWAASQQTLATGGRSIILSTPNGVGNFFHKIWADAHAKLNKFNTIRLDWTMHPDRDAKWREDQEIILGQKRAAQECDADFVSSGNSVVLPEILQYYSQTFVQEPVEKRGIENAYWIWQYADYSKTYVVSADVARGDGNDYSTLQVIDIETLDQVAEYKGKIGTKEFGMFCVTVATEYNNALLVIENANIGWATIQEAIDRNYPNLFYSSKDLALVDSSISLNKRYDLKEKSQLIAGFTTTVRTRPLIISKLDTYFREKSVTVRSKRLIDELFTFIWNGAKAEAMSGYNDDLVMAYAIGLWVRDTAIRLRTEGIELQKVALSHITKVAPVLTPNTKQNNAWNWNIGGKNEDLTWLI